MSYSSAIHSIDTLRTFTQVYVTNKKPNQYPKLVKFRDVQKKQEYIRFSKFEEHVEMENDAISKIQPGDHHYFPPNFHHIPAEKCKSKAMEHESPWNENFGNTGKSPAKKQAGCVKKEKRRKSKSKREIFIDVQMCILKCVIPQIGFLCDLKKAEQMPKRKRSA